MIRNLVNFLSALMLLLSASAFATTYNTVYYDFPDQATAYTACVSINNSPPASDCTTLGQMTYRQCNSTCTGSAGPGVLTCKSNENIYTNQGGTLTSCNYWDSNTSYFFRYPATSCPNGMTFVGPMGNSCVAFDSSSTSGPSTDINVRDADFLGHSAGGPGCGAQNAPGQAPLICVDQGYRRNPIVTSSGNKYQAESDFIGVDGVPSFIRYYNSIIGNDVGTGIGWSHSYANRLEFPADGVIYAQRPDGKYWILRRTGGVYVGDADIPFSLTEEAGTGFTLAWPDGRVEHYSAAGWPLFQTDTLGRTTSFGYNSSGRLASVTGPYGHVLSFTYLTADPYRVNYVTEPNGSRIYFAYDSSKHLTQASYPVASGSATRTYSYTNGLLTGITNELGVAYAAFAYGINGLANLTTHSNDSGRIDVAYGSGTAVITDGAGNTDTLLMARSNGANLVTRITHASDNTTFQQAFDANNNLTTRTDELGNVTSFAWDALNRLTQQVEASGTAIEHVTAYAYRDASSHQLASQTTASVHAGSSKTTQYSYDSQNRVAQVKVTGYTVSGDLVSRQIDLTYAAGGQLASVTDSNGHSIQLTYSSCSSGANCGQLASLTNAAGQVTTFDQYDTNGRLLQKTAPNGLVTTYTYNPRGNVLTLTETPATGTPRTTSFVYDKAERMTSASLPGQGTLIYTYDAADRLTSVTDALGNKVTYAYDTRDNRTQDVSKDPNGTVVRQVDREFNAWDRLGQINTAGSITQLIYDAVGNVSQVTDPNGNQTTHQVDALDRLVHTVDAIGGATDRNYDTGGNLTGMATPNGATTTYEVDDLGNVLKEASPDRGVITYTHDANGNVLMRMDARGITATFAYDVLNRVTAVSYPNPAENVTLTYDTCQVGQLCSVVDQAGTRSWSYDGFGRVASETWVQGGTSKTTSYTWTPGDDLASVTYPSGRTVAYTRNAIGNVTAVSTNGSNVLTGRTYRADGMVKAQTWANGITEAKAYDLQGRMTGWTVGNVLSRAYAHDANGNVVQKDTAQFQYDPLDRLTWEPSQILAYDGNGNRLLDAAGPYSYTPASNRMATGPPGGVVLDAAGNTLAYAGISYVYNQAGKLVSATAGSQTATYTYRNDGLRSSKTVSGVTTFFHYDFAGRLIAETDANGATLREYVWDDEAPVAQIEAGVITYLHTDQLGTPRLGTNSAGAQVWAWDSDAFGTTQPTGTVTVNLRFPGQYFDAETGLHQNGQRTFDPLSGRYLESDPIGLAGGGNTFGYVGQNPLGFIDPNGLQAIPLPPVLVPGMQNPSVGAQKQLAKQLTDIFQRAFPQKTYQTYTRFNPKTGQCYSGRTSGYDDPLVNIRNRALSQPLLSAEGFLPPVLDRSSENYGSIRGREQQLIEINGGARSSGGTSRNMINGISPYNPRRRFYLDDATAEFGAPVSVENCTCRR